MNTEKMSHAVQMTANVGVLIGLSLLVYELNQNNQHLQEQIDTWTVERRAADNQLVGQNPDIASLLYPHIAGRSLTALDELHRERLLHARWVNMQWVFNRVESGISGEIQLANIATIFRFDIEETQSEDVWKRRRRSYQEDFVEFMDTQVIANPG